MDHIQSDITWPSDCQAASVLSVGYGYAYTLEFLGLYALALSVSFSLALSWTPSHNRPLLASMHASTSSELSMRNEDNHDNHMFRAYAHCIQSGQTDSHTDHGIHFCQISNVGLAHAHPPIRCNCLLMSTLVQLKWVQEGKYRHAQYRGIVHGSMRSMQHKDIWHCM